MRRYAPLLLAGCLLCGGILSACGGGGKGTSEKDAAATIAALQRQLQEAATKAPTPASATPAPAAQPPTPAPPTATTTAPPTQPPATQAPATQAPTTVATRPPTNVPTTAAPTAAARTASPAAASSSSSAGSAGTGTPGVAGIGQGQATLPASGSPFEVLSAYGFLNNINSLHIVGEVRNNSGKNAEYVKIAGTFYGPDKSVAASEYTYALRDIVPAGEVSGYDLFVSDADKLSITSYKLQISFDATTKQPVKGLKIQGDNGNLRGDTLKVVGEVANTGTIPLTYVKVIALFYDANGRIVDADSTSTEPDTIAPGDTSSFEIDIYDAAKLGIKKYSLLAEGDQ